MTKEDLIKRVEAERKAQKAYNQRSVEKLSELNAEIKQLEREEMAENEEHCAYEESNIAIIEFNPKTVVSDLAEMLLNAGVSSVDAPETHNKKEWRMYRKAIARNLISELSKQ